MKSVLGVGVNTLDYTILTKGFPIENGKNLGYEQCDFHAGGPIPNALVCLSRLGYQTSYIGNTSQDIEGDAIVNSLKKEGVNVSGIARTAIEANKSFIISNNENESRTVLWRKIPKTNYLDNYQVPYDEIERYDIILIDGLEKGCTENIVKFAKKKNKRVIYGAESTSQTKLLLPYVDVLVAPEEAIKRFTGVKGKKEVVDFLGNFPLKQAFITEGKKGSYGIDFNTRNITHWQSFPTDAVDSTGAGDAFLAGIAYSSMNERSIKDSLIIASAIAALNCLSLGGRNGLPNESQLKDFLRRNNLEGILK